MPQLLVCRVDTREVALPIERVVEVLRMAAVSAVPHSPPWLSGMLNLRGRIIPVIDLRRRLGLPAAPVDLSTALVIVATEARTAGLMVDYASEVLDVPPGAIDPPDPLAGDGRLLAGMARAGARLLLILAVESVVAPLSPNAAGVERLLP
jgi:purine-binding chemotaxis protein CheW